MHSPSAPGPTDAPFSAVRISLAQDSQLSSTLQTEPEAVWELHCSALTQGQRAGGLTEAIAGVEGAFMVHGVLSPEECGALIIAAEGLGFCAGESLVEVPVAVRNNQVVLMVATPTMASELSARLAPFIPVHGHGGAKRCDDDFINRRWRCYRYPTERAGGAGRSKFGPHYDGAQPRSAVRRGELIDDVPPRGVTRLSQMSVLLYLSGGHEGGGETTFYPTGQPDADHAVKVSPRAGSALCFFHGRHPLSPLHEGSPLQEGAPSPKYVIRTDVLYATEPPTLESAQWEPSNLVAAMMNAARVM